SSGTAGGPSPAGARLGERPMSTSDQAQQSARLRYRPAVGDDSPVLATMNRRLIIDEGHTNSMSVPELEARMRYWLEIEENQATLIEHEETVVGYALWQPGDDWVYVRHFFIDPEHRRNGFGREAMAWLR